tara:strand:- start:4074 stop:4412 length:339 start_codon:yes stop_codon:yes gene_type:complete
MKNLFCALAFMLIGTFAFANNGIENNTVITIEKCSEITIDFEKIATNFEKKEKEKKKEKEAEKVKESENENVMQTVPCLPVTFCGTKGCICCYNSMEQFFDFFWYFNDLLCD